MPILKTSDMTDDTTPASGDRLICVDGTDGSVKLVQIGNTDTLIGYLGQGFSDKTANFTLTSGDHGKLFTISGTDLVATLPATSAGLVYHFLILTPSSTTGFSISPDSNDAVNGGTDNKDWINTAATDAAGDFCTVYGNGTDGWYTLNMHGIWAAEA